MSDPVTKQWRVANLEHGLARLCAGVGPTVLFVTAILAGSALGQLSPGIGERLGDYVDYTVLVLVCLLMFEIRFARIGESWLNIRFLSTAWMANFVVVPLIGFAIASLFLSGQPLFFTGLMIYFMAPCTDWFLGFTRLAKGDTALGTVLLPINMITQLLLYPLYLHLFAEGAAPVGAPEIGSALLQWFLLPFVIAIATHQVLARVLPPVAFSRLLAWAGYAVPFVIALLILEIFAANIGTLIEHASVFVVVLVAIFMFFVATFVMGAIVSRIAKLTYPEHALLTMTTAARNAPMMLGVTAIAIPDQPLIYATIVVGMLVEFPHLTALRQILIRGRDEEPGTPALSDDDASATSQTRPRTATSTS
ncbi:arsenic resistance protein [Pseudochelatococcus sp. B33]